MAKPNKLVNTKCWQGWVETGTLVYDCWEQIAVSFLVINLEIPGTAEDVRISQLSHSTFRVQKVVTCVKQGDMYKDIHCSNTSNRKKVQEVINVV